MKVSRSVWAPMVLALLAFSSITAFADSVTFDLNVSNGNISPAAASYGTVNLTLNADGTIAFLVTMAPGYGIAGGGAAFGFNPASGVGAIAITGISSGFSQSGAGNLDGFGQFAVDINGPPPGGNAPGVLGFTVSQTGGFTTVYQLVALNGKGWDFAAHVIPNGSTISTGFAATNTIVPVPERGDLILPLAGLVCFGGVLLNRKQRRSTS